MLSARSVQRCHLAGDSVSAAQALRPAAISVATAHYGGGTQPAAFGEGAGILIKATTESGCLLGAAVPGQRGVPSEEIGARAATELLEDLQHGGCVDRWCGRSPAAAL